MSNDIDLEFDRDDVIGQRLRALHSSIPDVATSIAWDGVQRRRRRKVARAVAVSCAVVAVFAGSTAAIVATRDSSKSVQVVTPTPSFPPATGTPPATASQQTRTTVTVPAFPNRERTQPVAPVDDRLQISPAGPYTAGQRVEVTLPADLAGDYVNEGSPSICYRWSDGEVCDPEVQAANATLVGTGVRWEFELPGWVFTPDGRQSCEVLGCRIEAGYPARLGSEVLAIAAGPRPDDHARVVEAGADGTIALDVDNLQPDPSWVAWSRGKSDEQLRDVSALGAHVCVFGAALYCDGLVNGAPIPPDGGRHRIDLTTNRQQFTFGGWRDCVTEACVVVVTRTVGVQDLGNGGTGSSTVRVAVLPYRLPADTPPMPIPRITLTRPGPFAVDEPVEVTLHDLPGPSEGQLSLAQCAANELGVTDDCVFRNESWSIDPGTQSVSFRVTRCNDERGCYIAIAPPANGYDSLARTERFRVTG
jgi:hypothetical protein